MRFFIKRSSKRLINRALLPALFMVSAFALSWLPLRAEDTKHKNGHNDVAKEQSDSLFTARSVFERIQTSSLEILPPSVRLDMLDYWDVDSVYKASNAMQGLSWLEEVTPTYLKVRITAVSSYEVKILPDHKGKIVMTVYTVGDDEQSRDSQLKFYDESLTELPTEKYIEMPRVKDFFEIPKGSATKMREIEDMIPFPTVAFTANPDNDNLEARLTVEQYVNQDDWNIAKLFVKPFVTLEWKKDKYKILNNK